MSTPALTRRHLLGLGAAAAGAAALPGADPALARRMRLRHQRGHLQADRIQQIVGIEGTVTSGVLSLDVGRDDIGDVKGPQGVTFSPAFELDGTLTFQPLGGGEAFFNGDLALKAEELNPVIDAIHGNGLVFQAMHQHYFGLDPMVWFIHLRGVGSETALATAVRNVLDVTKTPLPQKPPANPTTPLDHAAIATILHGSSEIGDRGAITVTVSRKGDVRIGDVVASSEANVSTTVEFLPLDEHGTRVAAGPDFSLSSAEVEPVCKVMRTAGFEIGCLYNQETAESPQLYFAHMLATGEPLALARAIRAGLDHTRSD